MNENMELLSVSSIKPIIDGLEPQEITDIASELGEEEEWHNDAVVNVYSQGKDEKDADQESFDMFFDTLSTDVEGASTLISEILEKKRSIKDNEASINKERESFNQEKLEFEKYKSSQLESVELEKRRLAECVK